MPKLTMPELTSATSEDDDLVQPKAAEFKIFTGALKAFEKDGDTYQYLRCTASSTAKDLHGDEMTAECVMGMAPQAKSKAMTIFLNHSYKMPEDVFGKVTDAAIVQRSTDESGNPIYDLDLEIQLNKSNPRGAETYSAIKDSGIKAGVSIGAMIEDYEFIDEDEGWWGGLRIKQVNLLEASIVGIPANQRSWVVNAMKALGAPPVIIQKALGRGEPPVAKRTADLKPAETLEMKQVEARYFLDGVDITNRLDVVSTETPVLPDENGVVSGTLIAAPFKSWTIKDAGEIGETTPPPSVESSAAPSEESQDETDKSADADDPAEDEEATGSLDASDVEAAVEGLKTAGVSGELLEIVLGLFEGATEEVVSLRSANAGLIAERDQARQEVLDAAQIVETIARTPLGRKAHFVGPVSTFRARYAGYYDEGFLKLLEERNQPSE